MTLEEAIKHAEEVAVEQDKLCKRYDDASGYSRSHNEAIRVTDAKKCEECAEEHRQLAEWLKDYKRLLKAINDAKEEINYKSDHSETGMSCGLLSALVIIDKYVYGVKPISTNGKDLK